MPNLLSKETSPYLQQHKDNPVEWHAWNDEALKKAKDENKPIFLSVGYSSCHWCHVMAHESFENDDVAKIMNENLFSQLRELRIARNGFLDLGLLQGLGFMLPPFTPRSGVNSPLRGGKRR